MYIILLTYIYVLIITVLFIILKKNGKRFPKNEVKRYHTPLIRQGEKIPKIIHQIWIGGEMPEYRKVLTSSINDFCREGDVTYILWDNNVLTPGTPQFEYIKPYWGIILKFLKGEKVVWAKVADILRYILLYTFGGCYLDTTFEIVNREKFRNYWEKYDSYDFVGCNETNEGGRGKFLSNGFFMCKKGSVNMRDLLEKLEYINIDGPANETTGPYFFVNVLKENYTLIKTPDIYPFYPWANDGRGKISKCYNDREGIPISVYGKNLRLEFPCKKYDSVLVNHWSGGTWISSNKNVEKNGKKFFIFDMELFFKKYNYYFLVEFIINFLINGWTLISYEKVKYGNLRENLIGKEYNEEYNEKYNKRYDKDYDINVIIFLSSKIHFYPQQLHNLKISLIIEDLHFDNDILKLKSIYPMVEKIYARYPDSLGEIIPDNKIIGFSHYASCLCYLPIPDVKIDKLLLLGCLSNVYPLRRHVIENLPKEIYSIRNFRGYTNDDDSYLEYIDYVRNINMYSIALCDTVNITNINNKYILAKIFEIPACNTAILTHYNIKSQMEKLGFIENYHYIACDESDILSKLNFWLSYKNRDKLLKIIYNGNKLVKEKFNLKNIYSIFQ